MAVVICVSNATAQFLPQLQARTAEEYDAYLDVEDARGEARIATSRRFLVAYPDSDLRLPVYEVLAEACRLKGDAECALSAAAKGLALTPDYIPLLTLLAAVDANVSPTPRKARSAALRAIELLGGATAPKRVDAEVWLRETARLRAENLAALGIVAYKAGDSAGAVRSLEESLAAKVTPANQYRLAMLYLDAGRTGDARPLLERAAADGDPPVKAMAGAALKKLRAAGAR